MRAPCHRYSLALAAKVCLRIAHGEAAYAVCKSPGMPSRVSIRTWRIERPEFRVMYDAACLQRDFDIQRRRLVEESAMRPRTTYTPELAAKVCAYIADGACMKQLSRIRELPSVTCIYGWLGRHEEFRAMYQIACDQRADALAEEMLAIADDAEGDWTPGKDGQTLTLDRENIQRSRLRIDQRRWHVARLAPTKYGERPAARPAAPTSISYEDALDELE